MGSKLANAPVYFTIAQVKFNPILALDSYAAKIQDRLRREGYPDCQQAHRATFNLAIPPTAEAQPMQIPASIAKRYVIRSPDQTSGFLLDEGALTFQTTQYDVFASFAAELKKGLAAVHDCVQLSFTDRVGMRYLDAIVPKAGEGLDVYLAPSVLGLTGKLKGKMQHGFFETSIVNGDLQLTARAILHEEGEIGFPPDLLPNHLQVASRFTGRRGLQAILDTDASVSQRKGFDMDGILADLSRVHDELVNVFHATVTPAALKAWE